MLRTSRPLLGIVSLLAAAVALGRADEPIPVEVASTSGPGPAPASSALFRNELIDVVVKEDAPSSSSFDALYRNTARTGSTVLFRKKLGDRIVVEQSSTIGKDSGDPVPAALGPLSGGETTSAYNVTAASWQPVAPLTLRVSNATEQNLSASKAGVGAGSGGDSLLTESRRFEADWQAAPHTTLSLAAEDDRNFDYGTSAYDLHRNTGLTVSQLLGKSNVTWNVTPSWEEDTTGGEWASTQAGPQLNTSFDWKQAEGTKWTVGGGWNQMDAVANAVEQSTRALFVAYDRAVSRRLKLLLRTDYENQASPRTLTAAATDQEQLSVRMGQKYEVSETLSAQLDVRHSFQQENREAWGTSESMATFSLKKSF